MLKLLEGVRVIECAVLFNGDQTGRLLADMGADVIKVESTRGGGDYLRDILGQITPHNSPAHLVVNRNKRSVTLNLRSEEGREKFFELLRTADIFVDGFAGDACARLGIGYEDQARVKPDIIYAQCSGFGARGPLAQIPTHGQMMGALGGGVPLQMCSDGLVRQKPGEESLADGTLLAATYTALAAVAALNQRSRTGKGAYIDGAGSDAVMATRWFQATYSWNDSRLTDRAGLPSFAGGENTSAKYQFYETADNKFILFCAIEHKFWDNFCNAVDRTDLLGQKDTAAPIDFSGDSEPLRRELQKIFHTKTLQEWTAIAIEHDIAMAPANQLNDLLTDEHIRTREMIIEQVHPHAGPFTSPGWPAPVAGQPFEVYRPAPGLGEHTEELLREIGCSQQELDDMRSRGVI
jgi:crotonobetainyl-CoA:carnitine CoA-transferase CaiB-like acyl-CoA transferase